MRGCSRMSPLPSSLLAGAESRQRMDGRAAPPPIAAQPRRFLWDWVVVSGRHADRSVWGWPFGCLCPRRWFQRGVLNLPHV